MKISKKVLGAVMAVIMILNVFAVGAFAAVPADTLVQLNLKTDKTVYAPGDEVVITFGAECIEELGSLMIGGQYEIGYNSAVMEAYSNSTALADHGYTAIQAGDQIGISVVQLVGQSSGPSPLYDWDTTICYCLVDSDVTFDATAGVDLFSIKMKIKADAPDGTYTIGYNPQGYEDCNGYINDGLGYGGLYGASASDYGFSVNNMYGYGTTTFQVSSGPSVEVTHAGQQSSWKYGKNVAENYRFGFLGNAAGLTVEADGNNVTNINSIVATATIDGSTVSSEVKTIWTNDDGSYGFRAVFDGFDYTSTSTVSVTFAINMSDGTTVYRTAEAATATINGIYTASVANGLPVVAA